MALFEGNKLIAQVVKVTPNYLLVEIVPGVLAMVPKGEFETAQYSPGEDVEVTLLTINQARAASPARSNTSPTSRRTNSPSSFPDEAFGTLGTELASPVYQMITRRLTLAVFVVGADPDRGRATRAEHRSARPVRTRTRRRRRRCVDRIAAVRIHRRPGDRRFAEPLLAARRSSHGLFEIGRPRRLGDRTSPGIRRRFVGFPGRHRTKPARLCKRTTSRKPTIARRLVERERSGHDGLVLGPNGADDGVRVTPRGGSPVDVWLDRGTV